MAKGSQLFANPKRLESVLRPLLKASRDNGVPLAETLFLDELGHEALVKTLVNEQRLVRHYDVEYVLNIMDYVFAEKPGATPAEFVAGLEQNLGTASLDWIAIIPLDYHSFSSDYHNLGTRLTVGPWRFISPRATLKRLNQAISARYQAPPIQDETFEHQNRSGSGFLSKAPLLCRPVRGTFEVARAFTHSTFEHFRWLQDLFIAHSDVYLRGESVAYVPNRHFYLLNVRDGALERVPSGFGTRGTWRFNKAIFRQWIAYGFGDFVTMFEGANNDLLRRVRNSLRFFSKGLNERQGLTKFIFYIIALEALFSRDKGTPLRVTLADYSALLAFPPERRADVHSHVRRLYDVRSKIVHNGVGWVPTEDVELAERLCAIVLMTAVELASTLVAKPKPEDAFFDHLLALKLR